MPKTLPEIHLPIHLRRKSAVNNEQQRTLYRTILDATALLGIAFGNHESGIKESGVALKDLIAELEATKRRESLAWEIVEILLFRFKKLPRKHFPHYTAGQRFRILEIKNLLHWSAVESERVFMVCANTFGNWFRDINTETKTSGSLAKPMPPVTRIADAVRRLVQTISQLGYADSWALASHVTANGHSISARTVSRVLKEKKMPVPTPPDPPAEEPPKPPRVYKPVSIKFVKDVWMMDSTFFKAFFCHLDLGATAVFDGYSRVPLLLETFYEKPSGSMMAKLLRRAVRQFGAPKYMITDQGPEFISKIFRKACDKLGIALRFASKENIHATARLERFWRTLKDITRLRAPNRALDLEDLQERLAAFLTHYTYFRPHRGDSMDGATPAEIWAGVDPAVKRTKSPPRGRPGQGPSDLGFDFAFVESKTRNYPFLVPAAA